VLLAHHLRQLKLPTFLREYEKVVAESAREGLDHVRFLLHLVELELIDRKRRLIERRIHAARFPAVKSFDTFDFTAIPSLNKPLTLDLARCEYVVARDNVIALGNSGTGRRMRVWRSASPSASMASPLPSSRRPGLFIN
jgi:DNA replication protein DnaC